MLDFVNNSKKTSKLKIPYDAVRLLVLGNGMVGHHFLKQLISKNLHHKYDITVIGDESVPAYNRIKLGEYVDHRDVNKLLLEPEEWYSKHGITLKLGDRANQINREEQYVELDNGQHYHYDLLVIATGSRPTIPKIEGIDLSHVLIYRTISDLKNIIEQFKSAEDIAVIGGGLLGIEAAHTFKNIGVNTTIIQRANFLMTRQLNTEAAAVLQHQIEDTGIEVVTKAQKISIQSNDQENTLIINDDKKIKADYVLISTGITPNTEFADEAGIDCGLHGGCIVNTRMQTNDSNIFAIGECAQYEGRVYGLAAPGFEMAEHLATLLASEKKKSLHALDTSTRLKMTGVDVSVIGESLESGTQVVFKEENIYRMLIVNNKRRLIGAMAVGTWSEYADIHHAYTTKVKLSRKQLQLFSETGEIFEDQHSNNPLAWEDNRMICNCMSVTKGEIMSAIQQCGKDPAVVAQTTKASTVCGSCDYLLKGLCGIEQPPAITQKVPKGMLITSVLAFVTVLAAILLPPAPIAESVNSLWAKVDAIWRDNLIKQITGYSMLAIFTLGLLVSFRKRLTWFNFGKYNFWRYFHVAFGLISLVVLYAHTGFHFGHNLNFWLMLVFIILNLLGAITGIVVALENTSNPRVARFSQSIRPYMLWGHIILFWPLPVLVAFHILSVYTY